MFCPNCGTQNDSAATPCKNCGFRLSGVSASKFKGTMMLNSDQTVQEMIDEHKKKRAETASDAGGKARASSPPAAPAGSVPPKPASVPPASGSPPSSGVAGTPRPVFQPPRAGAPKRRMGGTMLGVAPQVGGVAPPPDVTATPPPVQAVEPSRQEHARSSGESERAGELSPAPELSSSPDALPLAGTVAMPIVPDAAPVPPTATMPERPVAGRTQPLVVAAEPREEQPHPDTVTVQDRAPAMTAPLPQYGGGGSSDPVLEDPAPPPPRRIRPFEIALIVLTCGLYGIVVLLRQRRSPVP